MDGEREGAGLGVSVLTQQVLDDTPNLARLRAERTRRATAAAKNAMYTKLAWHVLEPSRDFKNSWLGFDLRSPRRRRAVGDHSLGDRDATGLHGSRCCARYFVRRISGAPVPMRRNGFSDFRTT